ncbi:MAG TPA: universal stress protein [Chitinophagaceae bacterium]
MKKFLAVFDGYKLSKSTLAYAQELATVADAHLVGIFLDDFVYHTYSMSEIYKKNEKPEVLISKLNTTEKKKRDEAVRQFEESCEKANISYSVRRNNSLAILELEHESMFADLIIISEHETFSRYKQKPPTHFMKDLLADVQCSVLVVPANYQAIDKIVLLYDSGPSSMHAIKMFSYLFSNLRSLPVQIYSVKGDTKHGFSFPDTPLVKEFIKRHFPNAKFTATKGDAEKLIVNYLKKHKENELVVLGAYRRSEFSRWFKTSMADILMRELDTPLFIAHNK